MDIEWNELDDPTYKIMDIEEPMITEDFADTGTVLVYIFGTNGLYYNSSFVFDNISIFHVLFLSKSVIGIHAQSTDGAPIDVSNFVQVRYVLLPDGMPLGKYAGELLGGLRGGCGIFRDSGLRVDAKYGMRSGENRIPSYPERGFQTSPAG